LAALAAETYTGSAEDRWMLALVFVPATGEREVGRRFRQGSRTPPLRTDIPRR
jgi:hypothetical protein